MSFWVNKPHPPEMELAWANVGFIEKIDVLLEDFWIIQVCLMFSNQKVVDQTRVINAYNRLLLLPEFKLQARRILDRLNT